MKRKYLMQIGLVAVMLSVRTTIALASSGRQKAATTLPETARQATRQFKDVQIAEAADYGLFHGCVSGPQEGAMGIHFANGNLVDDGKLEASQPEALLYEANDEKLQLLGVEDVVIADSWNASHDAPPVVVATSYIRRHFNPLI